MKKVIHLSTRIFSHFVWKTKNRYWVISQLYRVAGSPSIFALGSEEYSRSVIQARKNAVFLINLHKSRMVKRISRKKSEKKLLNMEWHPFFLRYSRCDVCVKLEVQIYLWWNFQYKSEFRRTSIIQFIVIFHDIMDLIYGVLSGAQFLPVL